MENSTRIIKKYPNRRLYDTEKSEYIKITDVLNLVRQEIDFKVLDAQTDEDITRSVLVQIIIEQESGESPLFTTETLMKFIRFYDDTTRNLFSDYLEQNLELFTEQQKAFQEQMDKLVGSEPMHSMTEMAQRNLDYWQQVQSNFFKNTGFKKEDEPDN